MALGAPQSSSLSRKTAFLFLVASFFPFSSFAISPLPPGRDTLVSPATNPAGAYDPDSSGVSTDYSSKNPNGTWSLVTISSGVSGIHWAITPLVNTLVLIDRSDRDNSYVKDVNGNMASASVLDLANVTAGPRGLDVLDNTFCSAGQFWPNGTLINTGGFQTTNGNTAAFSGVRHLDPCPGNGSCDFYEYPGEMDRF